MNYPQFIPLAILWLPFAGKRSPRRELKESLVPWHYFFYISAACAFLQLAYLVYKRQEIDKIALGADLFLFYGAIGYALDEALLMPFKFLGHTIIFIFVFVVGIVTSLFSTTGFIQIDTPNKAIVRSGSLALLGLTLLAFMISYTITPSFMGTKANVVLPFMGLVFARHFLRNYLLDLANK